MGKNKQLDCKLRNKLFNYKVGKLLYSQVSMD